MFDDKSNVDQPDRSRVAAIQEYEVRHLAGKYGLSQEYVRDLIARVGNDPVELDRLAKALLLAASTFWKLAACRLRAIRRASNLTRSRYSKVL